MSTVEIPKAVVFDLGKVLLDFDYGILARRMEALSDVPAQAILQVVNQTPLLHRYETGLMGDREFFEAVVAATGFRGGEVRFLEWFGDIFTEIVPMVGLHEALVGRGIPTYVFSNTNAQAIRHVRQVFPFYRKFTGEVLSYEVRSMKPDAGIYEAVERLSGFSGADLLYLDDRSENIAAGASRGWRAWIHEDPLITVPRVVSLMGL
ncbi:MAG: HAD family phosphatase [Verrucomicrobium sp.]|jgi:FMN phosphatase YigB (HAD superfamily)|nr:HAD family phosphatase [Verrucomicrobium sp.]